MKEKVKIKNDWMKKLEQEKKQTLELKINDQEGDEDQEDGYDDGIPQRDEDEKVGIAILYQNGICGSNDGDSNDIFQGRKVGVKLDVLMIITVVIQIHYLEQLQLVEDVDPILILLSLQKRNCNSFTNPDYAELEVVEVKELSNFHSTILGFYCYYDHDAYDGDEYDDVDDDFVFQLNHIHLLANVISFYCSFDRLDYCDEFDEDANDEFYCGE
ncbi:MAG: hypothetical protein EZS28_024513 [Streblomastix strix]|uniref:Uncharacterized protein n=1 Tax=Streblomastix strix TaxID=222440 RepID=A0A5J4VBP4_9EUKA|nr:MAG: hypothetical protein EZS28_024513 [Streblomastix strix]